MKILHLELKPVGDKYAEFRFFWDNPNDYQSRQLPLTEIAELLKKAETDYRSFMSLVREKCSDLLRFLKLLEGCE